MAFHNGKKKYLLHNFHMKLWIILIGVISQEIIFKRTVKKKKVRYLVFLSYPLQNKEMYIMLSLCFPLQYKAGIYICQNIFNILQIVLHNSF